jgi:DNA modification methylase
MSSLPDGCCDLVYADPPFFTGKNHRQTRPRQHGKRSPDPGPASQSGHEVADSWPGGLESYLGFLRPRLEQMRRLLKDTGTLYVHLDWHAVHYVKVMLDEVFGFDHFLNEIIWWYRTGGRNTRWLARKHDTILAYARVMGRQKFHVLRDGTFRTDGMNHDEDGRPYKQTRAGRLYFHPDGPALTDVWELPFLSTVSLERTGYPTQKPEALLERIVQISTDPGDTVADFFCGSGTTLAVADRLDRRWIGCDISPDAVGIARSRLASRTSDLFQGLRTDMEHARFPGSEGSP